MSVSELSSLDAAVDVLAETIREVRRHLHAHPELSGQEHETALYLASQFDDTSVRVRKVADGRGLIVDGPHNQAGSIVALRGDTDALPIQDAKADCSYGSTVPGVVHACGHDAHAAMAVGALLALESVESPWPLSWRGILQPAEETAQGAKAMIAAEALEGVSSILALHVDSSRDVGVVGVRDGAVTASCDWMTIRLKGDGGHGARPHETADPIAAAAQLITSVYSFIPRSFDSREPAVLTFGQIAGGHSPNVIPKEVVLEATLRSLNEDVRRKIKSDLQRVVDGVAATAGVEAELRFGTGLAAVRNDPSLNDVLQDAAAGVAVVEEIDKPSLGGEDFANYLEHVPGAFFRLGVRSERVGGEPLHSPRFDIDERALVIGAKLLARAVLLQSAPKD